MEGLTPASAADLPPLGELLVDDPFWRYPVWGLAREGARHLRVWAAAAAAPGYLAVVTETGGIISVTESAGRIRVGLARRYGPSLVLLEHHPAPESCEGVETLDLVRIGADEDVASEIGQPAGLAPENAALAFEYAYRGAGPG